MVVHLICASSRCSIFFERMTSYNIVISCYIFLSCTFQRLFAYVQIEIIYRLMDWCRCRVVRPEMVERKTTQYNAKQLKRTTSHYTHNFSIHWIDDDDKQLAQSFCVLKCSVYFGLTRWPLNRFYERIRTKSVDVIKERCQSGNFFC